MAFFNSDFDTQHFLQHYWQRHPLVIRGAYRQLPDFDVQRLFNLAEDEAVESRLIEGTGDDWQLDHGPFTADDLAGLPNRDWTLLVQDADKFDAELAKLLGDFNFVPDWRLDDIMVSYAAPGGSVGPHTDGYDVFLLQAVGHRRWQISSTPVADPIWVADCDLRILDNFQSDQEFVLGPGDMLYLPPHHAHHGVAEDTCMTYSVGFRAPSGQELLDAALVKLLETGHGQQRFQDPSGLQAQNTSEISLADVNSFQGLLRETLKGAESLLPEIIGELVTAPKPALEEAIDESLPETPVTYHELCDHFSQDHCLTRNRLLRIAWVLNETQIQIFYAGESSTLPSQEKSSIQRLCDQNVLTASDWTEIQSSPTVVDLLLTLLNEGVWQF